MMFKTIPIIVVAALVILPFRVEAAGYVITPIAQTGDTIGGETLTGFSIHQPLSINDSGEIAFEAEVSAEDGIFTQNRAVVLTGDTIGGKTLVFLNPPSINNEGEVAYPAVFSGGSGIFTSLREAVVLSGDVISGETLTGFNSPLINDSGEMAFLAIVSGISGSGIFTPSGAVALVGDVIGGKTLVSLGFPAINDMGEVVYLASFSGGRGIFTQDDAVVVTGDTIGGKTLGVINPASINDSGELAFQGRFSGGNGIFTQNSAVALTGDVIDGKTLTNTVSNTPSINDSGEVAFFASFTDPFAAVTEGDGVFTQNNAVALTGDTIGEKTLTGLGVSPSINSRGQVAFKGLFSDGSAGVFVASLPVTAVANLLVSVLDLNLPNGISKKLEGKLADAAADLQENDDQAAIDDLTDFIDVIEKQYGNNISEQDAEDLISAAEVIISALDQG